MEKYASNINLSWITVPSKCLPMSSKLDVKNMCKNKLWLEQEHRESIPVGSWTQTFFPFLSFFLTLFFFAAQFLTICLYNFLMKNHRRWSWRGSGEWFLKANFEVNRKTLSPSSGKQEKLWATWKGNSRRQKANKNKCGEEEKPSCARDDSFVFCCRHFYWFDSSNKNMS